MLFVEDEDILANVTDYSMHFPLDTAFETDEASVHDSTQANLELGNWDLTNSSQQYHSINDLNQILNKKGEGDFFALHLNAVSLVSHFDEIESLISAKTVIFPDVLCISETRLSNTVGITS